MGMYRGLDISVMGVFVYRGFYFGLYDIAKSMLSDDLKSKPM